MNSNPIFHRLSVIVFILLVTGAARSLRADTVYAEGTAIGSLFNTATRQHVQASFHGRGVLRPSGDEGSANGRVSSLVNERTPAPGGNLLGLYRVLAQAQVRYEGGSESISEEVILDVNRRSIVIRGFGRVTLDRPIDPYRNGRQRFRGKVVLTIKGI